MIDINALRVEKGGNPDVVRDSEIRRGRDGSQVDLVMKLDKEWVAAQYELEQAKKLVNKVNKEIGQKKKAKEACDDLVAEAIRYKADVPVKEKAAADLLIQRDAALHKIGNLVDLGVFVSNNEDNNVVIRTWGTPSDIVCDGTKGKMAHNELIAAIDGVELDKANSVAGHRAYYLKKYGAMLNQALWAYAQKFLRQREYETIQTPFFMRREYMAKAAELSDFNETLYRIPAGDSGIDANGKPISDPSQDLFMIATSEQPLCCLHSDSNIEPKDLPLKYGGISTCFRKEAGSHGRDMRGIFRVHQFEKVEQFVICKPEDSLAMHEEMIKCSEEFMQSIGLPYRVVSIVTGGLNDAAAKKYDLEAWFPSYGEFKELVSCSNCTDYQSRDLNIRLGYPSMGEREVPFVHMLNGTLCATERTMCCVLENWQTPEGIVIPEPLRPYMDDMEIIPYKN